MEMSRKRLLISGFSVVLTLWVVSAGIAQESHQIDPEMMEAYMKLNAPNENHEFLENFVGEWVVTTTAWMQPGAEPISSVGTAKAAMIIGGRFLKVDFEGTMFGQPFEGILIMGYDSYQKKNISFWIDSSSTAFYLTEGSRKEGTKKIVETGVWQDPMGGEDMNVRNTTILVSKDEYKFEMVMILPEGTEFKSMEYRAKRK
jgi:hypothetical protein